MTSDSDTDTWYCHT